MRARVAIKKSLFAAVAAAAAAKGISAAPALRRAAQSIPAKVVSGTDALP